MSSNATLWLQWVILGGQVITMVSLLLIALQRRLQDAGSRTRQTAQQIRLAEAHEKQLFALREEGASLAATVRESVARLTQALEAAAHRASIDQTALATTVKDTATALASTVAAAAAQVSVDQQAHAHDLAVVTQEDQRRLQVQIAAGETLATAARAELLRITQAATQKADAAFAKADDVNVKIERLAQHAAVGLAIKAEGATVPSVPDVVLTALGTLAPPEKPDA